MDWSAEEMPLLLLPRRPWLALSCLPTHRLMLPSPSPLITLDYAVGAMHEQWMKEAWQPLAFFNRQLCPTERRYSTFDQELLALYLAVRHFRSMLEGRPFTAFVDHKPLTFAMAKLPEQLSTCQQHHLSYISQFTSDLWGAVAQSLGVCSTGPLHSTHRPTDCVSGSIG